MKRQQNKSTLSQFDSPHFLNLVPQADSNHEQIKSKEEKVDAAAVTWRRRGGGGRIRASGREYDDGLARERSAAAVDDVRRRWVSESGKMEGGESGRGGGGALFSLPSFSPGESEYP
ncbi:hypothetical protein Drorol1_Dr00024894 [Drosera rotundifolia]